MIKCPVCGTENEDKYTYCERCGAKLSNTDKAQTQPTNQAVGPSTPQKEPENSTDEVKTLIAKRLDAIKNKDESTVKSILDDSYTKFDDWPPSRRQEHDEALSNEFSAFKVLTGYAYELRDFRSVVIGKIAFATYTIHYTITMNKQDYDITSRVTTVLKRSGGSWKVVHEHFSRYMQGDQQQSQGGRRRGRFPF